MKMVKIDGCLLKPCPNCGKLGYINVGYSKIDEDIMLFQIMCLHCGTCGPYETSMQTAANSWNRISANAPPYWNITDETYRHTRELMREKLQDLPRRTGNKV